MQAKTIVPVTIRNPLWNEEEYHAAKDAGREYSTTSTLEVDPGYVLDGPDAWIHCCPGDLNSPAIAEPLDDECREKVRVWMEVKRPAAIEQIRQNLKNIEHFKNPDDKARLLAMGRAYGLIGPEQPAAGKAPKKPAAE